MKKIRKKIVLLGLLLFISILGNGKVEAATASLSGDKTVTQGTSVTVTATVNAGSSVLNFTGAGQSNNALSAWVTPTTSNSTGSANITFNANTIGSYTFNLSGNIWDYSDSKTPIPVNRSCTITVVAANNGNAGGINNSGSTSNNNSNNAGTTTTGTKITSLGITPLEYDFDNYKVGAPTGTIYYAKKVPNSVTSISIYANGATSGTGTKTLKEGRNKFTVSNDTYTYYIVVDRATSDESEEPSNKPDDEERDEDSDTVIGLKSLVIEGYEFDKEFDPSVFEYKVKVDTPLTQEELNAIKEKLKAELNTEGVEFEVVAEITEENGATITITVKDAEKEYSKYVITFEAEPQEEDAVIGAVIPSSNNSNNIRGMFGLTEKQQIYAILGAFGLTFLIAAVYSVISFIQHRRLLEYTEGEYEDDNFEEYYGEDENAPTVIEQLYKDRNSNVMGAELQEDDIPNSVKNLRTAQAETVDNDDKAEAPSLAENISDANNSENVIEKAIDYERKLFSARSLRSGRRAGKH